MADIEKIKTLLKQVGALAPSGFGIAFHFRLTSPDFLFQTYPKNWIDIYSEKGYIMHDPIVRWGFSETGTARWSEIEIPDDLGILQESIPYGLKYGLAVTVDGGGTRSGGGAARADREFTDAEMTQMASLIQDLHDITASQTGMTDTLREELQQLSIAMTHPSTTKG